MVSLPDLVEIGDEEEVKTAIRNGSEVNQQGAYQQTALHRACSVNRTEIVKILLQSDNIDVNLPDIYGWTPFSTVSHIGYNECALLMLQDGRTDVNWVDYGGWTPLMRASSEGKLQTVALLLAFGRKIEVDKVRIVTEPKTVVNSDAPVENIKVGFRAIDLAKQKGHQEVVNLLENFENNPSQTIEKLRKDLDLKGIKIKNK